jgi:hypothetical protein
MAMRATVPRYTLQDLESFPDDGNRYELVDGILLVTPAPLPPHDWVRDCWLAVEVSGRGSRIYDRDHKRPRVPVGRGT